MDSVVFFGNLFTKRKRIRRTQQQRERDYIEESNGTMRAYEMKWNVKKANVKVPEAFAKAYPDATFKVVTPENVSDFLLGGDCE